MQRLAFRKIFNQFLHISYLLVISFTTKFELHKSNYFCGFNINASEKKMILSLPFPLSLSPSLSLSLSLSLIIIITNISVLSVLLVFYLLSFILFHIFLFVILFIYIIFLCIVFYISVCCILFGHMVLPWPKKHNQSINQSLSLPLSLFAFNQLLCNI